MVEKGLMDSIKDGGAVGAAFGFTYGAAYLYVFGRQELTAKQNQLARTPPQANAQSKAPVPVARPLTTASVFQSQVFPLLAHRTITYAGLGALFLGTETLVRNNRDKDDHWNSIIAGAVTGIPVGLRSGRFMVSLGASASMATAMALTRVLGTVTSTDPDYYKKMTTSVYGE